MIETSDDMPQERADLRIPAQDLLNFAVSNSPVIFYVAAIGGVQPLKFISANVTAITGHDQAYFLHNAGARRELLHPDDLPGFRDTVNALKAHLHDDETVSHEYRFRHADGSYLWFRDELRLNTAGSDGEARIIGCMIDITAEKESRDALQEIERRFQFIVEGYPLPVVVVDVESSKIVYESPAAAELFGRDWRSAEKPLAWEHYADHAKGREFVAELRKHGEVRDFEVPTRRADGTVLYTAVTSRLCTINGREVSISSITDMSERKKREDELRQAQEILEDAIESLSEGFALYDSEDRLVMCNGQYKKINPIAADLYVPGRRRIDILREAVSRGQFPSAKGREQEWLDERRSEGRDIVSDSYRTADDRWFDRSHRPTRQGGRVVTIRDVTEQRRMEQVLRDSESLVRQVLEGCPLPVQMTRLDGVRIYESPASSALFGDPVVSGSSNLHRYADPADRDFYIDELRRTGRVDNHICLRKRADGTEFWGAVSGQLIEYQGEQVIVSCTIDLTETKRREAELRESEELVRRVLEACPVSLSMSRVETGEYIYFSPANAELLGIEEQSAPVFSGNTYVRASDREKYVSMLLRDGRVDELEIERRRADGSTFWASMSSRLIEYKGEDVIVSSLFDLTERRAVEDEMARQREVLHQSEKLSAFGELLAGVSHELNNPLSVLLGQAILLKDSSSDDATKARAKKLYDAADRCTRIVKTFLAMARQRPAEIQSLNVNEIVEAALEVTAYSLRSSDIAVIPRLAADLPNVHIDPDQLRQVITNLVINAEHALLEISGERQLKIRTHYSWRSNEVVIKVKDNGPGIPEEIHRRIFEPLFTTKDVGIGTGIGLALCHRIIESHGGSIVLESAPGEGAAIAIRLPVDAGSGVAAQTAVVSTEPFECFDILVIDDEAEVGSVMCDILKADGHNATAAVSGAAGLRLLRERSFDLIFCDIRMPQIDGPEFYKALVDEMPEMGSRLAFVTGDYLSTRAATFLEDAGCPYIEKPATPGEIRGVLKLLRNSL